MPDTPRFIKCNGPCQGKGTIFAPRTYNLHGRLNHESGQPIPCPVCDGRKVVPGVSLDPDNPILARIGPERLTNAH